MDTHQAIYAGDTGVHSKVAYTLSGVERSEHVLVCGVSSTYKPALLWNLMLQDIESGAGVAVIDASGRFASGLMDHIPAARAHQTYFFQPHDAEYSIGFNSFRGVPEIQRARAAQEIMELFRAVWDLSYERTPLLLDILRSTARVLLDWPTSTFLSMYQLLIDESFRARVVERCDDPIARSFWREFESWPAADRRDKPQPVLTRLRTFLSDSVLRNSLGQVRGALDLERIVAERQVFLADFSARHLGGETSMLFGCLLASRFTTALANQTGEAPFHIYIPEAQLLHPGLAARLFALPPRAGGVVLSIDQIGGLLPQTRGALLSADTVLTFRLGPDDVQHLVSRFTLAQASDTLLSLQSHHLASTTHSYELTALPQHQPGGQQREVIIRRSRQILAKPSRLVDRKVRAFLEGELRDEGFDGWD